MDKYINANNLIKGLREQHANILKNMAAAKTDAEKEKCRINHENVATLIFLIDYLDGESVISTEEVEKLYFERDLALVQLKNDYGVGIGEKKNPDCVTVVRCKCCKHKEKAIVNDKGFLICPASGMEITDEDFCSYGERREESVHPERF